LSLEKENLGVTGEPSFTWKMGVKMVHMHVCVCATMNRQTEVCAAAADSNAGE